MCIVQFFEPAFAVLHMPGEPISAHEKSISSMQAHFVLCRLSLPDAKAMSRRLECRFRPFIYIQHLKVAEACFRLCNDNYLLQRKFRFRSYIYAVES